MFVRLLVDGLTDGANSLPGYIIGRALPDYAPAFALSRYDDPAYRAVLESWDPTTGKL